MVNTLLTQTPEELAVPQTVKKATSKDGKTASSSPFAVLMSMIGKSQQKAAEALEASPQNVIMQALSTAVATPQESQTPSVQAKGQIAQTKLSTHLSTLQVSNEIRSFTQQTNTSSSQKEGKTGADLVALLSKANEKGLNITKVEWSTTPPTQSVTSPTLLLTPVITPKIKGIEVQAAQPKEIQPSNELLSSLLQKQTKSSSPSVKKGENHPTSTPHASHKEVQEHHAVATQTPKNTQALPAEVTSAIQVATPLVQDQTVPQNQIIGQKQQTSVKQQLQQGTKEGGSKEETSLPKEGGTVSNSTLKVAVTEKGEKESKEEAPKEHHHKEHAPKQETAQTNTMTSTSPLTTLLSTPVAQTPTPVQEATAHTPLVVAPSHTQQITPKEEPIKQSHSPQQTEGATQTQTTELTTKIARAKETISTFATNLTESLSEFKAPMTKLSLSMNPENLGPVEVTLTQRGNAMQVTVSSPSQALFFMASNAAELKNSLSQTFGDVSMNFTFSQGSNQQHEEHKKHQGWETYQQTLKEHDQPEDAVVESVEITLPKYF